ncbi:MAG: transporter [Paucimonas sp.]|nr:transporter [Paucimonas sp.]
MVAHAALAGVRMTTSLYALSLHLSEFEIGFLIALFALFPMMFAVRTGRWIDRVGIRLPMLVGAALMLASCVICAIQPGTYLLYLAVIAIGSGFVVVHIATQHAVGSLSSSETRSANFSWLALGYSTSSFIGPVIAGFVIEHSRHTAAYLTFGGFAVLSLLLIMTGRLNRVPAPEHHAQGRNGGVLDLLRDREMRRIYLVSVLLGSAWDLFNFVMPIHGTELGFSASTIGLIIGCFSASTFVIRLAMHWISRRYSEWQVLTTALTLAVGCYLLLPLMETPMSIMLVTAVLGLALGSSQPNVLALLHHASPPGRAGEAVGIRVTISNASQVVLPLAFGAAGATLGLFPVFWGMGAMIIAGVPIAWRKAAQH